MADSESRTQRAAALEEKRRRLEELKQRRSRRGEDTANVRASASANLDEYIDGLLSQPSTESVRLTESDADTVAELVPSTQNGTVAAIVSTKSASSSTTTTNNVFAEPAPAPLPKTVETFTIGTQTDTDIDDSPDAVASEENKPDLTERLLGDKDAAENDPSKDQHNQIPKMLSPEDLEKEIASKPFSNFLNSASKKVERLLGAPLLTDLFADYVGESHDLEHTESVSKETDQSKFLASRQVYECVKWTSGRDVTDMDWSPLHRELLLSTYHMCMSTSASAHLSKGSAAVSAVSPNDTLSSSLTPRSGELQSDGLALVWNLTMPSRPEHVFTCGSPVTTGRFHPSESPLIVGGCESGQMVVWDVRAGRLPVQKSALSSIAGASSKGHVHPICRMEVVEGGSGIVTSSTDGRVNFWSLSNLREPVESVQVGDSVSCFAVAPESETLVLGDEYGTLYSVPSSATSGGQRSSRKQVRKLDAKDDQGESIGHYGMVTSLSTKTFKKSTASRATGLTKGFLRNSDGLVLSSGVDWTVKLWAPAYADKPLLSFVSHSYDYMSDVKWSPTHPSLFAAASSNGTVGFWNLAKSLEDPVTGQDGIVIEPDAMSGRGLNKLEWSGDGRRIAVASSDRLHVLTLSEEVLRVQGVEDTKMMNDLIARGLIGRP